MDVSDIFFEIFCSGEEKGEPGATGGGFGFYARSWGGEGAGRVSAGNWGGGPKFFFGAEISTKSRLPSVGRVKCNSSGSGTIWGCSPLPLHSLVLSLVHGVPQEHW